MTCNFQRCAFVATRTWQNKYDTVVQYCEKHSDVLVQTGLRHQWTLITLDRSQDGEDEQGRSELLFTC